MDKKILDYLEKIYTEKKFKKKETCIKTFFSYNGVNINVYFDNYDKKNPVLHVVFHLKNIYYLKTFNFVNMKKYLSNVPPEILTQLKYENQLEDFYTRLEQVMNENKWIPANYEKDYFYKEAFKKTKLDIQPFFWHLRKENMQQAHKELLYKNLNISLDDLDYIQKKGFTVVTTSDIKKRNILIDSINNMIFTK